MGIVYLLVGMFCGASVTVVLLGCLHAGVSEDLQREAFRAGYRRAKNLPPERSEEVGA